MEIICLLLMVFIFIINCIYYKNLYNPATIFLGFWSTTFFLYTLHLYELSYMSTNALLIFMSGFLSYALGTFSVSKIKLHKSNKNKEIMIDLKKTDILFIISFVILLFVTITNINLLRQGYSANNIRYSLNELSYITKVLQNFVAIPISVSIIALMIASIVNNFPNKKIMFYAITLLIMDILSAFETLDVYLFAAGMIFIFLYYISIKEYEIKNLIKKNIKKILIFLFIAILLLTSFRAISLFRHLYIYLTGGFVYFSKKIVDFDLLGRNSFVGQYTYGIASLQGLIRPIINILELFGLNFVLFNSANDFYWPYLGIPMDIGSGSFNYFSTPFLFFYKDLGMLGVILFSFFYGLLTCHFYKRFKKCKNLYNTTIYIFIIFSIFISLMEAPFVRQTFSMAIFYIMIMRKRVRRKNSRKVMNYE